MKINKKWEFHERQRKMPLTTSIFNNVLQSSGFSTAERLVREALQNSVDAHRLDADAPVSVRIEKKVLTGDEKVALVRALNLTESPQRRRHLFDLPEGSALENIDDPDSPLPVLIVSDYHTCGLGGKWDGTGEGDHFGRLVVNLGVDDKAEGSEISGGSFGFGKTVYGKSSQVGIVAFYSVFQPTAESDGAHARFMATGLFKAHEYDDEKFDGFAFFGRPDEDYPSEVLPFVDEEAHKLAQACGIRTRTDSEKGTSILILDCNQDIEELRIAAEQYWWPRLIQNELDLVLKDEDSEVSPRPRKNNDVTPFISCWQNLVSENTDHPRSKLFKFRKISFDGEMKQPGTLSCVLLESDSKFANKTALVRGPGMVVNYHPSGSDSYEPCVGVFNGHTDIEKVLTYSEPQMHDHWDENADRLQTKFSDEGVKLVRSVMSRVINSFKDFQRLQEPPIPPGGLQPKELGKLLGRFLNTPGTTPPPPPIPIVRPISIHVQEDRIKEDDVIWDTAKIGLELRDDFEGDELEFVLSMQHEVLGDASHRIVGRTEGVLLDGNGDIMAKGSPAAVSILLNKGEKTSVWAKVVSDEDSLTRIRVAVEEVL
jgi:hypothetical protein